MFSVVPGWDQLQNTKIQVYIVTTDEYERFCMWMRNSMLGRRCIININGKSFRFDTANERVMWADGFEKAITILNREI